jgi:hypothetical protein
MWMTMRCLRAETDFLEGRVPRVLRRPSVLEKFTVSKLATHADRSLKLREWVQVGCWPTTISHLFVLSFQKVGISASQTLARHMLFRRIIPAWILLKATDWARFSYIHVSLCFLTYVLNTCRMEANTFSFVQGTLSLDIYVIKSRN